MCKNIGKHIKRHKTAYLVALIVALFAVAILVLSQTEWFTQMLPEFRGLMLRAKSPARMW